MQREWNCLEFLRVTRERRLEQERPERTFSFTHSQSGLTIISASFIATESWNIIDKCKLLSALLGFLSPPPQISPALFVNLHFRPRACGCSRVLLAHTGCWGGGFCLLCRQASMARWAQYYSRGSSAANLKDRKRGERYIRRVKHDDLRSKLRGCVR